MSALLGMLQAIFQAVWRLGPLAGPRWVEPSNAITRAVYAPQQPQRRPRKQLNAYEQIVYDMPADSRTGSRRSPERTSPRRASRAAPATTVVQQERPLEERPAAKRRKGAA